MLSVTSETKESKKQNTDIEKSSEKKKQIEMEFNNSIFAQMLNQIKLLEKEKEQVRQYITSLDHKIQGIENVYNNSSVVIKHLPVRDVDNLSTTVCGMAKFLNINITSSDILNTYLLPSKNKLNVIVVDFLNAKSKKRFLSGAHYFMKYKTPNITLNTRDLGFLGKYTSVLINEYLPPSKRQLFFQSRQFAIENYYKFCWVDNGRIYLRKNRRSMSFRISSVACLHKVPVFNKT